jgi:hypothetical protein
MNSTEPSKSQEQTIALDATTSIQILAQFVEVAQQKGAFLLQEAEALKRAMDVLLLKTQDKDVNEQLAKQLLIQGVQKGQRHGAYTLNDAALLSKVVQFVIDSLPKELSTQNKKEDFEVEEQKQEDETNNSKVTDDLSDLAEPIPLKPKVV